ncbi:hypothetical protein [Persicirhabdus sediminis]|uniref:Uncharacterized protein n=1 Tax=Persicirhabdus sediminis TaxID=454144 RepID=A0A8J7MC75_9BACT|nr:hypothetical protein [Persicirhabdus sediminis]MBK1789757.1 hypothetical protein [Persicirhabdus sediminis]
MNKILLVPSYLWKNTLNRWQEHPASPLTKVFIPALLSLLAILVLVFFSALEDKLTEELSKRSIRTITVTETVRNLNAQNQLLASAHENEIWQQIAPEINSTTLLRPFSSAELLAGRRVPVFTSHGNIAGLPDLLADNKPQIYILSNSSADQYLTEFKLHDKTLYAKPGLMPDWLSSTIRDDMVIYAPLSLLHPLLLKGYSSTTLITAPNSREVAKTKNIVDAFFRAENRTVQVDSSVDILKAIHDLETAQIKIRAIIIVFVAIILALILGNISVLEYEKEAYLYALLRSFGATRKQIIAHGFIENLILVSSGIYLTANTWRLLLEQARPYIPPELPLQAVSQLNIKNADIIALSIAMVSGAVLATIPVILGLRKPTGKILQ